MLGHMSVLEGIYDCGAYFPNISNELLIFTKEFSKTKNVMAGFSNGPVASIINQL